MINIVFPAFYQAHYTLQRSVLLLKRKSAIHNLSDIYINIPFWAQMPEQKNHILAILISCQRLNNTFKQFSLISTRQYRYRTIMPESYPFTIMPTYNID